jgi:heptosyltransferase-3
MTAMLQRDHRHFVLSRVDSIGDVVLILPMARILKRAFPGCKVSLLVRRYTSPIGQYCEHVDAVHAWDEIERAPEGEQIRQFKSLNADVIIHIHPKPAIAWRAKQARIPVRIGTARRLYHWPTCNRLVYLRRFRSPLHEAQLNLKLLKGLGVRASYDLDELRAYFGLTAHCDLPQRLQSLVDPGRLNLIVHPGSNGTSREWPPEHFAALIERLPTERFNVMITGSLKERERFADCLPMKLPHVRDLMGALSLNELIVLIARVDGLVAASTGPLHIAAAAGKHALGIYSPLRAKRSSRWGPLGINACVFQLDKDCAACRNSRDCACMRNITPQQVCDHLLSLTIRRDAQERSVGVPPAQGVFTA